MCDFDDIEKQTPKVDLEDFHIATLPENKKKNTNIKMPNLTNKIHQKQTIIDHIILEENPDEKVERFGRRRNLFSIQK